MYSNNETITTCRHKSSEQTDYTTAKRPISYYSSDTWSAVMMVEHSSRVSAVRNQFQLPRDKSVQVLMHRLAIRSNSFRSSVWWVTTLQWLPLIHFYLLNSRLWVFGNKNFNTVVNCTRPSSCWNGMKTAAYIGGSSALQTSKHRERKAKIH